MPHGKVICSSHHAFLVRKLARHPAGLKARPVVSEPSCTVNVPKRPQCKLGPPLICSHCRYEVASMGSVFLNKSQKKGWNAPPLQLQNQRTFFRDHDEFPVSRMNRLPLRNTTQVFLGNRDLCITPVHVTDDDNDDDDEVCTSYNVLTIGSQPAELTCQEHLSRFCNVAQYRSEVFMMAGKFVQHTCIKISVKRSISLSKTISSVD